LVLRQILIFIKEEKMKRFFMVILFVGSIVTVYAQQSTSGNSSLPTSAQTKQTAQQTVSQAKSNSSQFESNQAALNASNASNRDSATYNRIKGEIDRLETLINVDQAKMKAALDSNSEVSHDLFQRIDRLIDEHKKKIAEMEAFIGSTQ
jgi:hypothetical protein